MIQDLFIPVHISTEELSEHISNFISNNNQLKASTIKTHQITLKLFHSYFSEKNNFEFLVADIKKYKNYLEKEKKMQPHSVKTYLSSLRRFCNYLVQNNILEKNPAKRIKLKNNYKKNELMFLKRNEIETLLMSLDRTTPEGFRDSTIISLILYCHINEYEIVRLNYEDVQLHRKKWYLNIRQKDKSENEIINVPHPAFENLQLYINKYDPSLHDGHPLFFSFSNRSKNKRMSIRGTRVLLEKRMQKCFSSGLLNLNSHLTKHTISILRNTSAIMMAKNGTPIENLMKRLKLRHKLTAQKYYEHISNFE